MKSSATLAIHEMQIRWMLRRTVERRMSEESSRLVSSMSRNGNILHEYCSIATPNSTLAPYMNINRNLTEPHTCSTSPKKRQHTNKSPVASSSNRHTFQHINLAHPQTTPHPTEHQPRTSTASHENGISNYPTVRLLPFNSTCPTPTPPPLHA